MDIDLKDALAGFETTFEHMDGHKVHVKRKGVVTFPGEVSSMYRRRGRGTTLPCIILAMYMHDLSIFIGTDFAGRRNA